MSGIHRSVRRAFAVAATTAALLGGGLVAAAPAGAAAAAVCDGWGATGTPGDIVGAYAHGTTCLITSGDAAGRVDLRTYLKDTAKDGMSACVQIHATYADGNSRDEWFYNYGGVGAEWDVFHTFASSVRHIWVREGRGTGGVCTVMAGGVHPIYVY